MSNVENIADHMALTCHCGSVRFCLLRSGSVECASCQEWPGIAWQQTEDDTDEASECTDCGGKGWNDLWKRVTGHYEGGEVARETCEQCDGSGKTKQ